MPKGKLRSGTLAWARRNSRELNWEIARDLGSIASPKGAAEKPHTVL